jgi:cytochrome b561
MISLSMRLSDTPSGYGWISILLHWLTAVAIIVLLFAGSSIASTEPEERIAALNFHTSVGVSCYVLLWARIVWRFWVGHPGPNERQRGFFYDLGKWTHYALIIALGAMLLTGPGMAWASGTDIAVFDWFTIPAASEPDFALRDSLHVVHRSCAIIIFIGIVMHLGGVYKHTAFNHDGTFVKMILPGKE